MILIDRDKAVTTACEGIMMDVNMNICYTCPYYQLKNCYCEKYLRGKEIAVFLCPDCKSKNEEMQEVANKDAFYGEALND